MIQECLNNLKTVTADSFEGYTEEEVIAFEGRNGVKLPEALREYYLVIGKNRYGLSFLNLDDIEISGVRLRDMANPRR